MNIAIDIRPIVSAHMTGVGEYTHQLLTHLILENTTGHDFYLFYNAFNQITMPILPPSPHVHMCEFSYPNKIFNTLLATRQIQLDTLVQKKYKIKPDVFFFPNLGFINTSASCKTIITIHDLSFITNPYFFSLKRRLWHKVINPKHLIKNATQIIAVSENTRREVLKKYTRNENTVQTIYPGISERFKRIQNKEILEKVKKKYKLPASFILFLGTVEPRKNIPCLIDAFQLLNTPHNLVIAGGNGWCSQSLYRNAKSTKKSNSIHFINYVDDADKPALYSLAELFVYPSFYEGFGFPPIEASRCKTPTITSAGSSINEIMNNNSIYINPYNPRQLTLAIKHALEKPTAISETFPNLTWKNSAKRVMDLFTQLA